MARLGWTAKAGESNDDQLVRPYVLRAALYAENANAIAAAHQLFKDNKAQLTALPADIRALVLSNEAKHFDSTKLFDQPIAAYRRASDASYKADLCAAVTQTADPVLINQIIEKFKDAETVKPQDLRAWFYYILANHKGEQAAWDWIRQDWKWLEDTVGGDMEFTTFITVITRVFHTPARLAEFKAFFEPKVQTPGLSREITMDTKVVASRVSLIEDEKQAVKATVAQAVK